MIAPTLPTDEISLHLVFCTDTLPITEMCLDQRIHHSLMALWQHKQIPRFILWLGYFFDIVDVDNGLDN